MILDVTPKPMTQEPQTSMSVPDRLFLAHSKGGKHPATRKLKLTARKVIQTTRPWEKSTGPTSPAGKAATAQNLSRWFTVAQLSPDSLSDADCLMGHYQMRLQAFRGELVEHGLSPRIGTSIEHCFDGSTCCLTIKIRAAVRHHSAIADLARAFLGIAE
jgi:hypothetical protein